ncbi:MAG TPA: ROK family protein, partial [Acidimicrobiales bacterium]|nr:ROK family protein [Acidimicrobiales bacterium]
MARALAVDVGGTKVAAAVVDDQGMVLRSTRAPTPGPGASAADVLAALVGAVEEVRGGDEVVCGVGCGGPMAAGGEDVSPLNIPAWRHFPLRRTLAARLGLET